MRKRAGSKRVSRSVLVVAATLGAAAAISPATAGAQQTIFACPEVADVTCQSSAFDLVELASVVDGVAQEACTAVGPVIVPVAPGTGVGACVVVPNSTGTETYAAGVLLAGTPIIVGTSGGQCVKNQPKKGHNVQVFLGGPRLGLTTC